jgi:hypothetical protein
MLHYITKPPKMLRLIKSFYGGSRGAVFSKRAPWPPEAKSTFAGGIETFPGFLSYNKVESKE